MLRRSLALAAPGRAVVPARTAPRTRAVVVLVSGGGGVGVGAATVGVGATPPAASPGPRTRMTPGLAAPPMMFDPRSIKLARRKSRSLLRTIDDTVKPGSSIKMEYVLSQTDHLIVEVVQALEGEEESEIVRQLLTLRDTLTRQAEGQGLTAEADAARSRVINIVNNFFYEKLVALPEIKSYMETMQTAAH